MHDRLTNDAVVSQRSLIFHLHIVEDQFLLIGRNALLLFKLLFDLFDVV